MKPLQLCAIFSFLLIWGCASQPSEQPSDADGAALVGTDSLVVEEDSPAEEPPKRPDTKPEAELRALTEAEEKASKAEQDYLGNPQLVKLVAALKDSEDQDGMPVYGKLSKSDFDRLTAKELLYYVVFHPESWDQPCSESFWDEGKVKAISPSLPLSGDYSSERQEQAIAAKMDTIRSLIPECIDATQTVSLRMLRMVVEQNVKSAIPSLIEVYKTQSPQNDLILSAFVEMMASNDFQPWIKSETAVAVNDVFGKWLPLTPENADKIMYYAKKYAAI